MRHTRDCRAGHPVPYFVLHRIGFSVPSRSRGARWALTPPFHPCPAGVKVRVRVKADFSLFTIPFPFHSNRRAVCFLWHFPSSRLDAGCPGLRRESCPVVSGLSSPNRRRTGSPRSVDALGAALPAPSGCFQRTERRSGPKTKVCPAAGRRRSRRRTNFPHLGPDCKRGFPDAHRVRGLLRRLGLPGRRPTRCLNPPSK